MTMNFIENLKEQQLTFDNCKIDRFNSIVSRSLFSKLFELFIYCFSFFISIYLKFFRFISTTIIETRVLCDDDELVYTWCYS